MLPPLRNGETAQLHDPKIENKETRPPPRYNEGTLIEAMQNAWRFVDDEVLRERLKEAKGIGTPATRAEIIGGLKKQGFLIARGKHIVPTEAGLSLFGVLKQADPALVDPGRRLAVANRGAQQGRPAGGAAFLELADDALGDIAHCVYRTDQSPACRQRHRRAGIQVAPSPPAMKRFADSLALLW